jgi:hypothetical protein
LQSLYLPTQHTDSRGTVIINDNYEEISSKLIKQSVLSHGYNARHQHEAAYYLLNSGSFKMSVDFQQTTWHYIPEDGTLQSTAERT